MVIAKLWWLRNLCSRNLWIQCSRNFSDCKNLEIVFENVKNFRDPGTFSKKQVLENFQVFEKPISQRNFEIIQFRNLAKSRSNFFLIQERKYRVSNYDHERSRFLCSRKSDKISKIWEVISKLCQNLIMLKAHPNEVCNPRFLYF